MYRKSGILEVKMDGIMGIGFGKLEVLWIK